jgi:UDPglucose 6-dehydrogenase
VVSNPEFLKEGAAIEDFMRPDRIIVGATDEHSVEQMRKLYAPFQRSRERLVVMDVRSAELTKYASNAMLATRISFMNELANLAETLGADIEMVRHGMGADPRIGYHFLYPGCGFGGSCFPKDVTALIATGKENGHLMNLLQAVQEVNITQKRLLADKVKNRFGANLTGKHFALWGLAFKPDTDDMREAPSLTIAAALVSAGATIRAYDPVAANEARRVLAQSPQIEVVDHMLTACEGADALLIATEWKEFRSPDFDAVKAALKAPIIFDGRNLYEPGNMKQLGFEYRAVGR